MTLGDESTSTAQAGQLLEGEDQKPPEGAAPDVKQGAEDTKGKEGDAPKTPEEIQAHYEKRLKGLQSEKDKAVGRVQSERDLLTSELQGAQQKLEDLESKSFDGHASDFLRQAEEQGVDRTMAQRIVDAQRQVASLEKQLRKRTSDLEAREQRASEAMKSIAAQELSKEFQLTDEDVGSLLEAKDPQEMELKALRLWKQRAQAGQILPTKTAPVKGDGKGGDMSGMSETEKAGTLWDKALQKD